MSPYGKAPVLVVDDNEAARDIICALLEYLGFEETYTAKSGFEAMEKLHHHKIALVISDWNMRPMNGLELLCEVRSDVKLRETRFILISGVASADHVIAAREAGANGLILKPFNAEGLKLKIADAFRPAGAPAPHSRRSSADWALSSVGTNFGKFPLTRTR